MSDNKEPHEANGEEEMNEQSADTTAEEQEEEKKGDEAMDTNDTEDKEKKKSSDKDKGESKPKTKNWPLRDIKEPHDNDVLYGRGGGTNHHPGNKRYRKMVEDRKLDYVNSKRLDKPLVALEIIRKWRAQDPPGRFLKLDEKTGLWHDVGDKKSREKTSQALREKAPILRKQQEEERLAKQRVEKGESDEEPKQNVKNTRFAPGTNTESNEGVSKAVLARDHSLGREYLKDGESVSLEGFSWQDPFQGIPSGRKTSNGSSQAPPKPPPSSYPTGRSSSHGSHVPPVPPAPVPPAPVPPPPEYPTDYRTSSHGSMAPPLPPPPPPDYYGRMTSDERLRSYSSTRYESWGRIPSSGSTSMPPPPVPGYAYPTHQRSGSWSHFDMQRDMQREHSLSQNPLRHASVSQPAPKSAFDSSRAGSGYWGDSMPTQQTHPPPPPPPHHHPSYQPSQVPPHHSRGDSGDAFRRTPSGRDYGTGASAGSPSPYSVDPAVAQTWSGGKTEETLPDWQNENQRIDDAPRINGGSDPLKLPRPNIVKRATSNQNETLETKKDLKGPSVKRAALNRDNSLASNRLKQEYLPEYYNRQEFDAEQEVKRLSDDLEQSSLGSSKLKPQAITPEERSQTLDGIAMDLMVKPVAISANNRSSTIEALDLDFDDTILVKPEALQRTSTSEAFLADLKVELPKPSAVTADNRLSTMDLIDIVNEPIAEDEPDPFFGK